jgi:hypothetical protein
MRVNILGCAPGWEEAPYDNGERWGINDSHKIARAKIDLAIDCHNLKRVMKGKEKLGRRSIEEVRHHLKLYAPQSLRIFRALSDTRLKI